MADPFDSELLIHAADVEGLCQGIDQDLVKSKLCSLLRPPYAQIELTMSFLLQI